MAGYSNFQVNRNKSTRNIGVFESTRNYHKDGNNLTRSGKLMAGIGMWTAYYRARPDVFAEEVLGIALMPFQKILLYCMMHYNYTAFFASRGLGKTFLTALYCVVRCILYPGTKIIVAAGQKSQSMKVATEKIPELISISTTGMIKREIKGSIRASMNSDEPNVKFVNGSWIKVVAATQGARSARANVLVLDEFRQIDPIIYRNVLRRFLATSRQPGYRTKPEYRNKPEYMERNQEIFLTSCYYKYNWSYTRFQVFMSAMLKGKKYFVCGLPYQFAIKENLTNAGQLIDELAEEDTDEVGWTMEMDCMFFGESEKAYFRSEELKEIQRISYPIYENRVKSIIKDKDIIKTSRKLPNEIRVLSCDIALLGGDPNDASVYTLICAIPTNNGKRYKRYVKNIESNQGMHPEAQALRIRRLFDDYKCDYIALDRNGNGISVYSYLCRRLFDNERNKEYIPFYSLNEMDDPKLAGYHLEDDYEKRIYTVSATEEFNHDIALDLKDKIINKRLRLLIGKEDVREYFSQEAWYDNLTAEDKRDLITPYIQTELLINEMVLLERIDHPKYIKLKEQSGKRKDRYSSLAYGNHFISFLEEKNLKHRERYDNDDPLVFF